VRKKLPLCEIERLENIENWVLQKSWISSGIKNKRLPHKIVLFHEVGRTCLHIKFKYTQCIQIKALEILQIQGHDAQMIANHGAKTKLRLVKNPAAVFDRNLTKNRVSFNNKKEATYICWSVKMS
jgi:hypothetical protein